MLDKNTLNKARDLLEIPGCNAQRLVRTLSLSKEELIEIYKVLDIISDVTTVIDRRDPGKTIKISTIQFQIIKQYRHDQRKQGNELETWDDALWDMTMIKSCPGGDLCVDKYWRTLKNLKEAKSDE